jgi:uncharacterized protein (DUF1501 family)
MKISRRNLLLGCSAAVTAYAGSRLGLLPFAPGEYHGDLLVVVFLRGGMDGLSLLPPAGGEDRAFYEAARPKLKFPLAPGSILGALGNVELGLHPKAMPLKALWGGGQLAIVMAAGMPPAGITRSHFDAMTFVELGTPGEKHRQDGWLARHLATLGPAPLPAALALGQQAPTSLLGGRGGLQVAELATYGLLPAATPALDNPAGRRLLRQQEETLDRVYRQGGGYFHQGGRAALDSFGYLRQLRSLDRQPNRFGYPATPLGRNLRMLAQAIRFSEPRPRAATLDSGIWDTHHQQGESGGGRFAQLTEDLASGIAAFWEELTAAGLERSVTVVVQSEFGRKLNENANHGTDHGYGNPLLVLSPHLRPGLHGSWPGLHRDQLRSGSDLEVTTDYRQVIAEVLAARTGNTRLAEVFPHFVADRPLGLFAG